MQAIEGTINNELERQICANVIPSLFEKAHTNIYFMLNCSFFLFLQFSFDSTCDNSMLMSGKVLKTNGFFKKKSILILGIYILLSTILYYVLCFATSAASLKFSTSPFRTLLLS